MSPEEHKALKIWQSPKTPQIIFFPFRFFFFFLQVCRAIPQGLAASRIKEIEERDKSSPGVVIVSPYF